MSRWVLVTDSGGGRERSSVAAVRALAAAGYRPAVAVAGPHPLASASRHCLRRVDVPPAGDPGFAEAIRAEVSSRPYVAVLPGSDAAVLALGMPGADLLDKRRLADLARDCGLQVPPTAIFSSVEEVQDVAADLEFPLVVKPAERREGNLPTILARDPESLSRVPPGGPVVVQPYVRSSVWAVCGVSWRGRLLASVHQRALRLWPPGAGTSSAAVTEEPDLELEAGVQRLLAEHDILFQAQFAGRYLIDLNPRVYGSLPLAEAAGANLPAIYCDLVRGADVEPVRARPGVRYRWIEGDVRSVAWAVWRRRAGLGAALRAMRPRRGTAHSTLRRGDPGPFLAWLRMGLRRR
jgi:hypothetical protein